MYRFLPSAQSPVDHPSLALHPEQLSGTSHSRAELIAQEELWQECTPMLMMHHSAKNKLLNKLLKSKLLKNNVLFINFILFYFIFLNYILRVECVSYCPTVLEWGLDLGWVRLHLVFMGEVGVGCYWVEIGIGVGIFGGRDWMGSFV